MTQLKVRASDISHGCRAMKFTKPSKILQNSVEILSNTMFVQHIWNFSQLLGLFTCCKLVNLSWNFVTKMCKQRPKTTRCRLCCSHDVKGFAIVSVLERIVVERANDSLLEKQNWSISNKVFPENNHKIGLFFTDWFLAEFIPKIPAKSVDFSTNLPLKTPWNLNLTLLI